jgi:hypothetical protein
MPSAHTHTPPHTSPQTLLLRSLTAPHAVLSREHDGACHSEVCRPRRWAKEDEEKKEEQRGGREESQPRPFTH